MISCTVFKVLHGSGHWHGDDQSPVDVLKVVKLNQTLLRLVFLHEINAEWIVALVSWLVLEVNDIWANVWVRLPHLF